jgi:hypothetical protein
MNKKASGSLMKDPFYAGIMHKIETLIHHCDEEALRDSSLSLTDSNVKSAIRKAVGLLQGKRPALDMGDAREQWISRIATDLVNLNGIGQKEVLLVDPKDYLRALLAVEDSLKTRREMYGHSRGYLDFLKRFIENGELH